MTSSAPTPLPPESLRARELYVAAAIILGVGAGITREPATWLTLLAASLATAGFIASRATADGRRGDRFLIQILAVGIIGNIVVGLLEPPLVDTWYRPLLALTALAAIAAIALPTMRLWLVIVIVVSQVAVAGWLVATAVPSDMDVHLFQQEASRSLLEGRNPYELRYTNIYGEGTPLYAPELQDGDRLKFGFPYPPFSLLMVLPSYALAGDYRYAAVASVAATALLLTFMRRGPAGPLMAALFVLSPITLRVLYNGWTEPLLGILLAAAVFAAVHAPKTTPLLVGLLIATKQYAAPILIPAALILAGAKRRPAAVRMAIGAVAVGGATILPFLAWNPGEFIHSVLLLQAYQPFRPDSVSIPGLLARNLAVVLPGWVAFVGGGLALAAVSRWAPRTPAGFAAAVAVLYFAFFLLSKQAFMNYYYFVYVALACAVAAAAYERGTAGRD